MGKRQVNPPKTVTKKIRAQVYYRDGYACQAPGCEHRSGEGVNLTIHHRDFDPTNNFRSNLVTMCNPCNIAERNHRQGARRRLEKLYQATKKTGTTQTYFPLGDPLG